MGDRRIYLHPDCGPEIFEQLLGAARPYIAENALDVENFEQTGNKVRFYLGSGWLEIGYCDVEFPCDDDVDAYFGWEGARPPFFDLLSQSKSAIDVFAGSRDAEPQLLWFHAFVCETAVKLGPGGWHDPYTLGKTLP